MFLEAMQSERWITVGVLALGTTLALLWRAAASSRAVGRIATAAVAAQIAANDRAQTTLTLLANRLVLETDERKLLGLITDAAVMLTGVQEIVLLDEAGQVVAWRDGAATGGTHPPAIMRLLGGDAWAHTLRLSPVRGQDGTLSLVAAHADGRVLEAREHELLELLLAQAVVALNNSHHIGRIHGLLVGLAHSHDKLTRSHHELDQLAYATSHDLRAPLRGLLSVTDWLEEDIKRGATADLFGHLQTMRQRILRLETMVDGVARLTTAGRRDGPTVEVALADVINAAKPLAVFPANTKLEVQTPLPTLIASHDDLMVIMSQLFANTISHSNCPALVVRVHAETLPTHVRVCVDDNGCGIPENFRERVWAPFETLQRRDAKEHTGLGLALVKKLVHANLGEVGIAASPLGGARVWFTWPRPP